ncbi:MAG: RluA family pseudouridine synthase [Actinobacteria bacterium]|nr:RluA family pseudouridine synthase [Actinomycetota bacterium]MBM3713168.1 RluA family pseudouridine synthase [Actinomycetota bacterium]
MQQKKLNDEDDQTITLIVDKEASGKRIDTFITSKIPQKSRSYIQKLIEADSVTVDGKNIGKNYRVSAEDRVYIKNAGQFEISPHIKPEALRLKIRYEDNYFLIISKEPGISVHPSQGHYNNTLVNAILYYYKNKNIEGGFSDVARTGIVHRLDKYTSGLIIAAKNDQVQRKLSDLFKDRKIRKVYAALVLGTFHEKRGKIVLPIGRSRLDRTKMAVSVDMGREAVTEFEVVEEFDNCTLLDVFPKTGRTHQIRVHFSYINHPVIGDSRYGSKESLQIARDISLSRQFLHAKKLLFTHPVLNVKVEIEDSLSEDLQNSLKILREKF